MEQVNNFETYKPWGWMNQKNDDDNDDWSGYGGDGKGLVK